MSEFVAFLVFYNTVEISKNLQIHIINNSQVHVYLTEGAIVLSCNLGTCT